MTTLEENLILARSANLYVKECLPYGAYNRPRAVPEAYLRVMTGRLLTDVLLPAHRVISRFSTSPLDFLSISAFSSYLLKAGNCGEQSAIALGYLRELGVKDLDFVFLENGDHAFMVIGRDVDSNISDYRTWGKNAVVCDPWAGRYYPACRLASQLNRSLVKAHLGKYNPTSQRPLSFYSEHQLDSARGSLDVLEKPGFEFSVPAKFKPVLPRFPVPLPPHLPRFVFPKNKAGAVACTVAAAGFFAASAIASQSARYADEQMHERQPFAGVL